LARNWLQKIAALEFEARGPRKNGGLLSGWTRRLFRGRPLEEVQGIYLRDWHVGATGWI